MAHQGNYGCNEKINAAVADLEDNINKYAGSGIVNDNIGNLSKDIQCIKAWVEKQDTASKNNSIAAVGNVIATTASSLNSLKSGDPLEVMKGCINIASSIAVVAGGPYGAAVGAICHVLGTILSINTPEGPNLATIFVDKVHEEILKLNQKFKREKFSGLKDRVKLMLVNLKGLKSGDLPHDKLLYETDFPQFIGEVADNFSHGLSSDSKDEDVKDCLTSMVAYCNAETSYLVLLSNLLTAFQAVGNDTGYIETLLKEQTNNAIEKLEYLSEREKYVSKRFPNDKGKLYLAFRLRSNHLLYVVVENFREGLGMKKMPQLEAIQDIVKHAELNWRPKDITDQYPAYSALDALTATLNPTYLFQLINHTSVPVKVVCDGDVGDHVNALKFRVDLRPFTSYEHNATTIMNSFSTGGYFIMYLDGEMKSFENKFESSNLRAFAFALSNPIIGGRKLAILDKTNNLDSATGNDCWEQMDSDSCSPINFVHGDKHYTVFGSIVKPTVFCNVVNPIGNLVESKVPVLGNIIQPVKPFGEFVIWQFVVQEYDPLKDMKEVKEDGCVIS